MPNGERTGAFCPTLFEQFVAPYPTQSQLLDVCTLGCTLSKIFKKLSKKVIKKSVKNPSFKGTPNYSNKVGKKAPVCSQLDFCQSHIFYLYHIDFFPELSRIFGCFSDQLEYWCPIKNLKNFGGFSILNFF